MPYLRHFFIIPLWSHLLHGCVELQHVLLLGQHVFSESLRAAVFLRDLLLQRLQTQTVSNSQTLRDHNNHWDSFWRETDLDLGAELFHHVVLLLNDLQREYQVTSPAPCAVGLGAVTLASRKQRVCLRLEAFPLAHGKHVLEPRKGLFCFQLNILGSTTILIMFLLQLQFIKFPCTPSVLYVYKIFFKKKVLQKYFKYNGVPRWAFIETTHKTETTIDLFESLLLLSQNIVLSSELLHIHWRQSGSILQALLHPLLHTDTTKTQNTHYSES